MAGGTEPFEAQAGFRLPRAAETLTAVLLDDAQDRAERRHDVSGDYASEPDLGFSMVDPEGKRMGDRLLDPFATAFAHPIERAKEP